MSPEMRLAEVLTAIPSDRKKERYSIALASAIVAVLLRAIIEPWVGPVSFYVTVYITVAFSALVSGLGPSILTAVLAIGGVVYWLVDPGNPSFCWTGEKFTV